MRLRLVEDRQEVVAGQVAQAHRSVEQCLAFMGQLQDAVSSTGKGSAAAIANMQVGSLWKGGGADMTMVWPIHGGHCQLQQPEQRGMQWLPHPQPGDALARPLRCVVCGDPPACVHSALALQALLSALTSDLAAAVEAGGKLGGWPHVAMAAAARRKP